MKRSDFLRTLTILLTSLLLLATVSGCKLDDESKSEDLTPDATNSRYCTVLVESQTCVVIKEHESGRKFRINCTDDTGATELEVAIGSTCKVWLDFDLADEQQEQRISYNLYDYTHPGSGNMPIGTLSPDSTLSYQWELAEGAVLYLSIQK